jgi:hypothetical protein
MAKPKPVRKCIEFDLSKEKRHGNRVNIMGVWNIWR